MGHYYTDERNAQIVIALMKAHGIRKVIASPGTTNICLIASIQNDPFFEIYSSIAFAAVLPAPIASITVAAPVTASPPA